MEQPMIIENEAGDNSDIDVGDVGEGMAEEDVSDEEIDLNELERRMWKDKIKYRRLKEQQKNIHEKNNNDRIKYKQSLEQARRKKMARAQDGILKYMLKILEVCKAQGFVYGIIPEKGKPVSGASDNIRAWWKEKVKFDKNGPIAIAKYQDENSPLGAQKNSLNNKTTDNSSVAARGGGSLSNSKKKRSHSNSSIQEQRPFLCPHEGCLHQDQRNGFLNISQRNSHANNYPHKSGTEGYMGVGTGVNQAKLFIEPLSQYSNGFPFVRVISHPMYTEGDQHELFIGFHKTGVQPEGQPGFSRFRESDRSSHTRKLLQQSSDRNQVGRAIVEIQDGAGLVFGPPLLVDSSSTDLCGDVKNWQRDGFNSVTGKLAGNHFEPQSDGLQVDYGFGSPFDFGIGAASTLDADLDFSFDEDFIQYFGA